MALYHKHRPQDFAAVAGQEHIIQTLLNQIISNRISHAYLFSGPRGIGKTTTARLLAKALNCEKRKENTAEPCNTCQSCQEIGANRSIDVIEIDAASNTGVDNVRANIIENAQFQPTKSKYKIFIIDEVHMLSTSAFNALLKIMEEPPQYIVFILATTETHKLPETVISRCQHFEFKRIPFEKMQKTIALIAKAEDVKIDKEVIDLIAGKSEGCLRDAVSLLDQLISLGKGKIDLETANLLLPSFGREQAVNFLNHLVNRDLKSAFVTIDQLTEKDIDLLNFANNLIELLRAVMLLKANIENKEIIANIDNHCKKELQKMSQHFTSRELINLLDLLIKRKAEIRTAPLPQLPLEMAAFEWISKKDDNSDTQPKEKEVTSKANAPELEKNNPPKFETKILEKNIENQTDIKIVELKKVEVEKENNKNNITLEDVQNKWKNFLDIIEQTSPSLVFILKMANIKNVIKGKVLISVQYQFHKDKLTEKKCQKELENKFSNILGSDINLEIILENNSEETAKQQNSQLNDLAAMFGGEVVT